MIIDFEFYDRAIKKPVVAMMRIEEAGYSQFKFVTEAFYKLYDNGNGLGAEAIGRITGYNASNILYHLRKIGVKISQPGKKSDIEKPEKIKWRMYQGKPKVCYECKTNFVSANSWARCDVCQAKIDRGCDCNTLNEYSCGSMIRA